MGYIYMLTSPKGKSYIGQTIRPIEERFKEHYTKSDSHCVAISSAIKFHGWENIKKEWFNVPDDELNFYEEMLVALLGTLSPDGYNIREGGGSGGKWCEEAKEKMRRAMTGKIKSAEHRRNIGKAQKGKTLGDDHKQKLSVANSGKNNPFYGRTHTDESNQKNRAAHTGKTLSDDHKQKLSKIMTGGNNHKSKQVYQYGLDGMFIQSFASGGEAARSLNKTDGTSINKCARGERPTSYGFKWSYTEL
jgi:group I intron endonuclease